jgi:hypothetical protein
MTSSRSTIVIVALLVAVVGAGCSDGDEETQIRVVVSEFAPSVDGLRPGVPLAGAALRLYHGDSVVFESVLDADGTAAIAPEPGTYVVQVELESSDEFCFWGETVQDVTFPGSPLVMEASYACAGG